MEMLLAHLTGDYLLQSKHMALLKSKKGWDGFQECWFHCFLYTCSVALFMWTLDPLTLILVFATHFIVDRWSLASVWLKLIKGRTFESTLHDTDRTVTAIIKREYDVAFTSIVYAVVDNTFHLISLWAIFGVLG